MHGSNRDTPGDLLPPILASDRCLFCGEPPVVEVLEYWPDDRSFLIDTCCEELQNVALDEMAHWSRSRWQKWFAASTGEHTRGVITNDCETWTLDYGLEIAPINWATARDFVGMHHRHNDPPQGWKFGAGLYILEHPGSAHPAELGAVVMVGRPVARILAEKGTMLEITRVCVKDIRTRDLLWNASSQLYGWACREIKKRGYERAITYTRETESGVSLRAASFRPVHRSKGGTWNRPSRHRVSRGPNPPKIRWERVLSPKAVALPELTLQHTLPLAA